MIWVIAGGIVGLIVWIWAIVSVATDSYSGLGETLAIGGLCGLIFGATVGAIVCFGLNGLMLPILHGNEAHHTNVHSLQAIAARDSTQGQFFLGSGQLDSDPVYRFYRTTPNGGFVLDTADASATVLYQDASTPRVIHRWISPEHTWWCLFSTGSTTYEIHVPKGSITATTNLDLP